MSSNIITRNNNFIMLILFRITENDKKLLRADESDNEWSSGREGNLFVKERSGDYKNRGFEKMYKKRVYTILGKEGSNKLKKSETESLVCMQGSRLYKQSFEERLQIRHEKSRTGWMTGSCRAKNSRTIWVKKLQREQTERLSLRS